MIWPAIYVSSGLVKLWYCIIFTVLIEWIILKFFLKEKWGKTFLMSFIGNIISGTIGIYIMPWIMIIWHFFADNLLPNATFDIVNWILTYFFMCLGSVAVEVLAVKIIFRFPFKRLFLPMLVGNALTYILTAILMFTGVIKLNF
ncbi:conserved membrane hypothetical protein [uncultured Paludibacter sp.]|nr:conserved membrane hypothetical protein [uncultured Paludibacter sp.]